MAKQNCIEEKTIKINIITIGKITSTWINSGFNEYAKRLQHGNIKLELIEISTIKRAKSISIDAVKQQEQQKIFAKIPSQSFIVTLDECGKQLNSKQLAANLKIWQESYNNISLIIGGPDGLSPKVLKKSGLIWSLSKLTFPHKLIRIILAEQIYRATTILQNHPYHR